MVLNMVNKVMEVEEIMEIVVMVIDVAVVVLEAQGNVTIVVKKAIFVTILRLLLVDLRAMLI